MGVSDKDMSDLDNTLKQLNLSGEEVDKFSKAFKDPEFIKLFEEYAKEVSDPKVKEETDLYLRQLEAEGRGEEVYGKGVVLVVPTEAFVVKSKDVSNGQKAFINICTSDKLEKMTIEPKKGPDGKIGKHVELPLSLSAKKTGVDKGGKPTWVWDFVVNPETVEMARRAPGIEQLLVETAMEHIKAAHHVDLSPKYKVLHVKYKGTPEAPKPHVLSVRSGAGGAVPNPGSRIAPVAAAPAVSGLAGATGAPTHAGGKAPGELGSAGNAGAGARSAFKFPNKAGKATNMPAAPLAPHQVGFVHASGEATPQWEMIHRGQVDLTECWGDAGRALAAAPPSWPVQLVLRLQLPGCSSAATLQLDVSRQLVSVVLPGKFKLETSLPFPVDDTQGKAKFDKVKQQLEVVLPTLPPPPPPTPPPRQLVEDVIVSPQAGEEATSAQQPEQEQPLEQRLSQEAGSWSSEKDEQEDCETNAVGSTGTPQAADSVDQALTENQRKWAEMHERELQQKQQEEAAAAAVASASVSIDDPSETATSCEEIPAFEASGSWAGARKGRAFKLGASGLGYYHDHKVSTLETARALPGATTGGTQAAHVAAAGVQLKPRLCSTLADDLD